ncbi:MAG TPA: metalloprotease TldD, partial [Rhodanobacteraceae bacterium]|nr:metalloprotease TldD [Rhodanobacteraceae bacterium]
MMDSPLVLAERNLLAPGGLSIHDLERVFSRVMAPSIDAADLYFQHSRSESWMLEDGIVREGSHSIEQGVGVRAIAGEKTGFAYSDDIVLPQLLEAAGAARAIAHSGNGAGKPLAVRDSHALYPADDPIDGLDNSAKIALLRELDALARSLDPRIKQVIVSLAATHDSVLVAAADGTLAADVRPLTRVNVRVIAEDGARREAGYAGGGGRCAYRELLDSGRAHGWAREAVRQALVNLEAVDAPAGTMDVVLGPGWPGILLHEAIGHGLEGDFNRKGTSAFAGRMGDKVAAEGVTVVDDGTLPGRRGSLSIDDEGTPTRENVLIEDGILKGYMQDRQNARLMGVAPTGNGRRQSYASPVMPRMTNTYMLGGDKDPKEILESVKNGIYAVNFGGGQVDITNGKFVFSCTEAYLIENGKVAAPVKGATLIGSGSEALLKIGMVGNDLEMD